jgi:hypothetical protein
LRRLPQRSHRAVVAAVAVVAVVAVAAMIGVTIVGVGVSVLAAKKDHYY